MHLRKSMSVVVERTIYVHRPTDRRTAKANRYNEHCSHQYTTKDHQPRIGDRDGRGTLLRDTKYLFRTLSPATAAQRSENHVLQNFMVSLYQNHRMEREVTYYAQEQYLTPRYFRRSSKRNRASRPCSGSFAWSLPTPNRCSVPQT